MRVIIVHDEFGVYLGNFLGLGFWSLLDSVGQDEAVTFKNETDAINFIRSWDENNDPHNYKFFSVPTNEPWVTYDLLVINGLGPLTGDMLANVTLSGRA